MTQCFTLAQDHPSSWVWMTGSSNLLDPKFKAETSKLCTVTCLMFNRTCGVLFSWFYPLRIFFSHWSFFGGFFPPWICWPHSLNKSLFFIIWPTPVKLIVFLVNVLYTPLYAAYYYVPIKCSHSCSTPNIVVFVACMACGHLRYEWVV